MIYLYFFVKGLVYAVLLYITFSRVPRELRASGWTARLASWSARAYVNFLLGAVAGEVLLVAGTMILNRNAAIWRPGLGNLANQVYGYTLFVGWPAIAVLISRRWAALRPPAA